MKRVRRPIQRPADQRAEAPNGREELIPRSRYVHGTHQSEQERLARLNRLTNEPFMQFLHLEPECAVLEVGCGLGILTGELGARFPHCTFYALEYSAEQMAYLKAYQANVRYLRGDAHQLPFENGRLDLVYCRYVLEHVADAGRVVQEMSRVLRCGGRVCAQENNALVSVFDPECPRFDHLWRQYVVLQARFGGDPQVGRKLHALFKAAGLRDIRLSLQPEIHPAGSSTFLPWVENMIGIVEAADLVKHRLATEDQLTEGIAEARAFAEREDATALFYWNRASGIK